MITCFSPHDNIFLLDAAMCDLSSALSPASSVSSGWDCTSDYSICLNGVSSWSGVTCSSTNTVTAIDLNSLGLAGSLPSTVGVLSGLTKLDLSYNGITGSLPDSMSQLINLQYVDLSYNTIYGTLPSAMDKLVSLEYFSVSANQLTGKVPYALCSDKTLTYLSLDSNRLSCYFDCLSTVTTLIVDTTTPTCTDGKLVLKDE